MPNEADQTTTLKDALDGVALSVLSDNHLRAFFNTLEDRSDPLTDFFTFLVYFIEYNRLKYLAMKFEFIQLRSEFTSLKREVRQAMNTSTIYNLPHVALQASGTSTPDIAAPTASGRTVPDPMDTTFINADS